MEKYIKKSLDVVAISLSVACAIHCLIMPFALMVMPAFISRIFSDQNFHMYSLITAFIISYSALIVGFRKSSDKKKLLMLATLGLSLMFLGVYLGSESHSCCSNHHLHDFELTWESIYTIIGVSIVGYTHYLNWKTRKNCCPKK